MIRNRKMLLADDSITIQKVVHLTFADEGMDVRMVSDGEQAISELEKDSFDIVLADVFIPGRSGYEVCEYIKSSERLRHIPVVLLVGTFEPFNEAEARRVGADDVLTKPFQSIKDLVSKVGTLLGSNQADKETDATEQRTGEPQPASSPESELRVSEESARNAPAVSESLREEAPMPDSAEHAERQEPVQTSDMALEDRVPHSEMREASGDRDEDQTVISMPAMVAEPASESISSNVFGEEATESNRTEADDIQLHTQPTAPLVAAPETFADQHEDASGTSPRYVDVFSQVQEPQPSSPVPESQNEDAMGATDHESADAAMLDLSGSNLDQPTTPDSLNMTTKIDDDDFILDLDDIDAPPAANVQEAKTSVNASMGNTAQQSTILDLDEPLISNAPVVPGATSDQDGAASFGEMLPPSKNSLTAFPPHETSASTTGTNVADASQQIRLEQLAPEVIDAIARRVVEQMSEQVIREIAWEVVPQLSELLIKRRLEEDSGKR